MNSAYEKALLLMACLVPRSSQHCLFRLQPGAALQIISQERAQPLSSFSVLDETTSFDNCLIVGLFNVAAKDTTPDVRVVKGCTQLQDLRVRPLTMFRSMITKIAEPVSNKVIRGAITNISETTPDLVHGHITRNSWFTKDSAVLDLGFLSTVACVSYDTRLYFWFVLLFRYLYWMRHMILVQIQITDSEIGRVKVGMERYYPDKEGMQDPYEEAVDLVYQSVDQEVLKQISDIATSFNAGRKWHTEWDLMHELGLYSSGQSVFERIRTSAVIEHADVSVLRASNSGDFIQQARDLQNSLNAGSDNPDVQYVFDMIKTRAASLGNTHKA